MTRKHHKKLTPCNARAQQRIRERRENPSMIVIPANPPGYALPGELRYSDAATFMYPKTKGLA